MIILGSLLSDYQRRLHGHGQVRYALATMPLSQLIFFVGWLAAALIGGALLVFVWEQLHARYCRPLEPPRPS
jgi:hypothetical protein